jgi:hypothetical protein
MSEFHKTSAQLTDRVVLAMLQAAIDTASINGPSTVVPEHPRLLIVGATKGKVTGFAHRTRCDLLTRAMSRPSLL